jgi:O-antigen biosynthesis protein
METQIQKPVQSDVAPKETDRPLLSVVIVSYNVSGFLDHCLDSVMRACQPYSHEIIVVDNSSTDNTLEMVHEKYPGVTLIENAQNLGYSRGNNQGIRLGRGRYILLLNPDTIVPHHAISASLQFLEQRPEAGLMSLKIVNADGSFQSACRRGFPSPMAALYRMIGLSLLFKNSRRFGQYNLTFLDENATSEVDAVCGAYMMARAEVLKSVGGFDEEFFMFGEDIDLCYRIQRAGYKVFYHPASEIIHFKGESSRKNRVESRLHFYNSMFIFSRKHFTQRMSFFPRGLLFGGILLNALVKFPAAWLHRYLACGIDLGVINATLFGAMILKYGLEWNFYGFMDPKWSLLLHVSLSLPFVLTFALSGLYGGKPRTLADHFRAAFLASLLFFSFVFFIPYVRFSRIAFISTCAVLMLVLPGWRLLFTRTALKLNTSLARKKKYFIIGHGEAAFRLRERLLQSPLYRNSFEGFILEQDPGTPLPEKEVAGGLSDLKSLVKKKKITEIFLAVQDRGMLDIVALINFCARSAISLKLVESLRDQDKFHVRDVDVSENIII